MASTHTNVSSSGALGIPEFVDLGDFDVVPAQSSRTADVDERALEAKSISAYCFVGEVQASGEIHWFYSPLEGYEAKKLRVERGVVAEALSHGSGGRNNKHAHELTYTEDDSASRSSQTGNSGGYLDDGDIFDDMAQTKLYMRVGKTGEFRCYVRREIARKLENLIDTPNTPITSAEKKDLGIGSSMGAENSSGDSAVAQRMLMGSTNNFMGLGSFVTTSPCARVVSSNLEQHDERQLIYDVGLELHEQPPPHMHDSHGFLQPMVRRELGYGQENSLELFPLFVKAPSEDSIVYSAKGAAVPSVSQNTSHSTHTVDAHAMHSVPLIYNTDGVARPQQSALCAAEQRDGNADTSTSCLRESSSSSSSAGKKNNSGGNGKLSSRLHFRSTDGVSSSLNSGADSTSLAQSANRRADASTTSANSQPIIRRLHKGRRNYTRTSDASGKK